MLKRIQPIGATWADVLAAVRKIFLNFIFMVITTESESLETTLKRLQHLKFIKQYPSSFFERNAAYESAMNNQEIKK